MKFTSLFFILIFSTSAFAQKDLKISQFGLSLQSENSAVGLSHGDESSLTPGVLVDFRLSPKADLGMELNYRRIFWGSTLSENYFSYSVLYKTKFKRFSTSIGPTIDLFDGYWKDLGNTYRPAYSPINKSYGLTARIEYKLFTISENYVLSPFVKINPQIINAEYFNLGLGIILSKMCKNGGKD
jgi:hypothetical protein